MTADEHVDDPDGWWEALEQEGERRILPASPLIDPRRMVDGATFVLDSPDEVPTVWGSGDQVLWAAGESLILAGPPGVGKTTITAQLVRARLGLSDAVLDWPVTTGRHVLYLASDRPDQIRRAMRRLFTEDDRAALAGRLTVWKGPPPADLAARPELLLELARAAGADTVILDSLKDMAVGLASDEVGAGLNIAIQRTLVEGIEVVALHHQRKAQNGSVPKSLEDVYGSTWLTAGAGSVVLLWGQPGDVVVDLIHLKQPMEQIGPLRVEHDHRTGQSTVTRGFDVLRWLRLQPNGGTAPDCARAWFETQTVDDNHRKKAQRALDRLVTGGLAHRERDAGTGGNGGTKATRYYAIDTHHGDPE